MYWKLPSRPVVPEPELFQGAAASGIIHVNDVALPFDGQWVLAALKNQRRQHHAGCKQYLGLWGNNHFLNTASVAMPCSA